MPQDTMKSLKFSKNIFKMPTILKKILAFSKKTPVAIAALPQ
jgi:hypothetical protein